jgi:hypothetical protein
MWRGNDVGYSSLHTWVKRNKTKPLLCENCNEKKPYDLANISGEYKRDLNDYKWLCRKCHMIEDGRINNLINGKEALKKGIIKQDIKGKFISCKENILLIP